MIYSHLFQHHQAGKSQGHHYCEFGYPDKEVARSALGDEMRALQRDPKEAGNGCGKGKNTAENCLLILGGAFYHRKKGRKRAGIVRAFDCSVWKTTSNNNIALNSGHSCIFLYDD